MLGKLSVPADFSKKLIAQGLMGLGRGFIVDANR
jgi:hypothetical protein